MPGARRVVAFDHNLRARARMTAAVGMGDAPAIQQPLITCARRENLEPIRPVCRCCSITRSRDRRSRTNPACSHSVHTLSIPCSHPAHTPFTPRSHRVTLTLRRRAQRLYTTHGTPALCTAAAPPLSTPPQSQLHHPTDGAHNDYILESTPRPDHTLCFPFSHPVHTIFPTPCAHHGIPFLHFVHT